MKTTTKTKYLGIPRQEVKSSNIKSIGHNGKSVLVIEFYSGQIYAYRNISKATYQEFIQAESIGKYFFANISGVAQVQYELLND